MGFMSKTLVRFRALISVFVLLLLAVIISNAPIAGSYSEASDGRTGDQASSIEKGVASSPVSYASQQSANSVDHIFALASHRFEPLMLLLLGSTFLFIGSRIKLLQSRRLRRNPGLLKSDN
jgi:hypothetical protein